MATVIGERRLAALRRHFRGPLVQPGDPDYEDTRRIWNAAIERRPAFIARCTGPADVVAALGFARENDLLVAVRGGGHNVSGSALCDGGMVIDLSLLRAVTVEPERRLAIAQPGVRLGELDRACQPFALAAPAGINTVTGVAGLTLGGGIGWLMRRHGLTCDNLVAAEVVSAEGALVRASDDENPELLWGLRGGGGNFGIVTSFEFRLHEVGPQVASGVVFYAAEDAQRVLSAYAEWTSAAPQEATTIVSLRRLPPFPAFPEALHGRPVVGIAACHCGPPADGEAALAPLRSFATPVLDALAVKPFVAQQALFDATVPPGWRYHWKSEYLQPLTAGAVDTIVDHAWSFAAPMSYTLLFHMGGAVRHLADDDAAFTGRDAEFAVNINMVQRDVAEPDDTAAVRRFHEAVQPYSAGGVYVNFLGDEGSDRIRHAYGERKWARLVELKRQWDPDNAFRVNQNIAPASTRPVQPR
jgi:FAD/FMN-containing dehydrogenase